MAGRWRDLALGLLLSFAVCPAAAAQVQAAPDAPRDRQIAITIDDLPWVSFDGLDADQRDARHQRLMAALDAAAVPVTGFVNEDKLEVGGRVQPARLRMLGDWLDRGHELGNHTHGHVDLHTVGLQAYQQAILDGERELRSLLAGTGRVPRWFRHPFLRAGRSAADRAALQAFLGAHGYRIAPVTVDNSDWIWASAYRKTQDAPPGASRDDTLARLRREHVPYMLAKVAYFERQSRDLLGREIAQVWLLHANELNAEVLPELVAGVRARGYRVVTLEQALQDPAYARGAEGYDGPSGPSWLHRWAIGEGKGGDFFAGEPETPDWVLSLAGVDSE